MNERGVPLNSLDETEPMQPSGRSLDESDADASGALPLPAVIFYGRAGDGRRALRFVNDLAGKLGGEFVVEPSLWRLELLQDPRCDAAVAYDVAIAGLIVIAGRASDISAEACECLMRCVAARQMDPLAVIAIADADSDADDVSDSACFDRFRRYFNNDTFVGTSRMFCENAG